MPKGAEILTAQIQDDNLCLWALVNPKVRTEIRVIEIFGTGNPISSYARINRKYISTFQIQEGNLVFHVFEDMGVCTPVNNPYYLKGIYKSDFIGSLEAAIMLKCNLITLCRYVQDGKLPYYSIGRRLLFRKEEILNKIKVK